MVNQLKSIKKWASSKFPIIRFSYIHEIFNKEMGDVVKRWVLLLPGNGCTWAKEYGGCYMCGFKHKIDQINKNHSVSHSYLMKICQLGKLLVFASKPQNLTIYNAGSFLNEKEIPEKTQIAIFQMASKQAHIREVFIESRPEFITREKISKLLSVLDGKSLMVGIGLECQSDEIRAKCIHKGFRRADFESAVDVLTRCGAKALTYVFLKPIYLEEKEAIEEAVKTTKYAFQSGSAEVALEAAFVQEGTKMAELYHRGQYRPPWLWSVIEVVKQTYNLGPITVGEFNDEPRPIEIPHNCQKCSSFIMDVIQQYRRTNDIRLFEDLNCECKRDWGKEVLL